MQDVRLNQIAFYKGAIPYVALNQRAFVLLEHSAHFEETDVQNARLKCCFERTKQLWNEIFMETHGNHEETIKRGYLTLEMLAAMVSGEKPSERLKRCGFDTSCIAI